MNSDNHSARIKQYLAQVPVIPVLEVEDVHAAIPLAQALVAGGLPVLEVTLRTPAALEVIQKMSQVDGAIVAAGTILNSDDLAKAQQAGAQFGVSPGATQALLSACKALDFPLMPGVASASEAMNALDSGYTFLKFFPAEAAGGAAAVKALGGPFKALEFCPTGGITVDKAPGYLGLSNVRCIGGSWVATKAMIASKDWKGIEQRARQAASLRSVV